MESEYPDSDDVTNASKQTGRISVVCQRCGKRFKSPVFDGKHDDYCSSGCRRRAEWGAE